MRDDVRHDRDPQTREELDRWLKERDASVPLTPREWRIVQRFSTKRPREALM